MDRREWFRWLLAWLVGFLFRWPEDAPAQFVAPVSEPSRETVWHKIKFGNGLIGLIASNCMVQSDTGHGYRITFSHMLGPTSMMQAFLLHYSGVEDVVGRHLILEYVPSEKPQFIGPIKASLRLCNVIMTQVGIGTSANDLYLAESVGFWARSIADLEIRDGTEHQTSPA